MLFDEGMVALINVRVNGQNAAGKGIMKSIRNTRFTNHRHLPEGGVGVGRPPWGAVVGVRPSEGVEQGPSLGEER